MTTRAEESSLFEEKVIAEGLCLACRDKTNCSSTLQIKCKVNHKCQNFYPQLKNTECIVYHGSKGGISGRIRPDYKDACAHADFGKGFYMGTTEIQPKSLIMLHEKPVFYTCKLDLANLCVKYFDADFEWIIAVALFRGKLDRLPKTYLDCQKQHYANYDIFCGYIADDSTTAAIMQFISDNMGYNSLMSCLLNLGLGKQYVAVTQKACDSILVLDNYMLTKRECDELRKRTYARRLEAEKLTRDAFASPNQGRKFSSMLAEYLEVLTK